MCPSRRSCNSNSAIVSRAWSSLTNSAAARMAMAAATLASQCWLVPYCCNRAIRAGPVWSKPSFWTKKSTFASPVLWRLSSSSSSSSSSTCCHCSSSSTSARKEKAVSMALRGRSGTAFIRSFAFVSAMLEIHSKAKLRVPSSMVPLAPAKASIIATHSEYRGLKKAAFSDALEMRDCKASSNAEGSLAANACKAPSAMGSTGCKAWLVSASSVVTISATSPREAAWSPGVPRPVLTRAPSSCRLARMAWV
mmetsp:Transcript_100706/g.324983  ORF Transcript_100706/g.324983 Transcript_100706/m.324983 type:complete len:251 (+) Transcript_100706:2285-3037(+)